MIAERTSVDQLDLQIGTFSKTITVSSNEIVQDVLTPAINSADEPLQGAQSSGCGISQPDGQEVIRLLTIHTCVEPVAK